MNLVWCCVAAVLVATANGAAVDIEKTVLQVQTILKSNSLLPRLSREEILQLLNDIRAEDSKSTSASREDTTSYKSTTPYSTIENEIVPATNLPTVEHIVINNNKDTVAATSPPVINTTTNKPESSVMVVLPYTPRDGSSLQELYTRPPRVEVVPVAEPTSMPTTINKLQDTLTQNAKTAEKQKEDLPAELQAFLDAHGLTGKPGEDHFLLPLEGFKPLPPARVVDGTVQLPENILLAYDLISPSEENKSSFEGSNIPANNFLFEPLRPEIPFELDTSSSETKETVYPLDIPKTRKTKSTDSVAPNYDPIEYDSFKVIPLNKGISPVDDTKIILENEQSKRQTNSSEETTSTTTTEEPKSASSDTPGTSDSAPADSDSGPSLADLEDSFGGAAPEQPGDAQLPPPRKNGFYWMVDWNSFLEVGDGDNKVNIRFEPKLGDPQMFLPVSVP